MPLLISRILDTVKERSLPGNPDCGEKDVIDGVYPEVGWKKIKETL